MEKSLKVLMAMVLMVVLVLYTSCVKEPPVKDSQATLPEMSFIKDVPVYRQGHKECGPMSLQMVMNFYGKNLIKDEIVKSMSMNSYGTTLSEMERYAKAQKFEPYTFYGREKKMKYLIAQGYPLIAVGEIPANWYPNGSYTGLGHFVVVVGYDDNEKVFTINDPGPGRMTKVSYATMKNFLSSTKFKDYGYVLCIYPKEGHDEHGDSHK